MDLKFLYLVAVFISSIEFLIYYKTNKIRANKDFLAICASTFFSNYGYAMSVYASSFEATFSGFMLSYVGSVLTVLFLLLIVIQICNIKFPLFFQIVLVILGFIIVLFIGKNKDTNLFFKNPRLENFYGLSIIHFENGPAMYAYFVYLIIINVTSIAVLIFSIIKKIKISKKTLWILLTMMIFGTTTFIISITIDNRINLMPFIYIIMEAGFIILTVRVNMYDLSSNLMNVYKTRGGYGYIAFDIKKKFLGCDDFAIQLFPELLQIAIDTVIPKKFTSLRNKIKYNEDDWYIFLNKDFNITNKNGISAICTIHNINYKSKIIGFLLELRDNTKQQNYISGINLYNKALSQNVKEKTKMIIDIEDSIIEGMATVIESRDNSTGGHILRTSECIRILVNKLKQLNSFTWCTEDFCNRLIKAAPMHDIGKIAVNDSILRKPGLFTQEEYEEMKKHAEQGKFMVSQVLKATPDYKFKEIAENVAQYHHEKWDGTGYPDHKKGEEIPIEARIMALADVFDALVSERCYKEAKSFNEAFSIIKENLGIHFDPIIGTVFLQCRPELEMYYKNHI